MWTFLWATDRCPSVMQTPAWSPWASPHSFAHSPHRPSLGHRSRPSRWRVIAWSCALLSHSVRHGWCRVMRGCRACHEPAQEAKRWMPRLLDTPASRRRFSWVSSFTAALHTFCRPRVALAMEAEQWAFSSRASLVVLPIASVTRAVAASVRRRERGALVRAMLLVSLRRKPSAS